MKIDPHNHKGVYTSWKEKNNGKFEGVSNQNSALILRYLNDMEKGINISNVSVKGPRSYGRLLSLKTRLTFFSKKFRELYNLDNLLEIKEDQLLSFFADMRSGDIKKINGGEYKSIQTYVKIFKAFWHWHMKTSKKKGIEVEDITVDLDTTQDKPKWVYLTEEQVKKLCDNAKYEYKILIMFLFDSGIRSPSELINIKVSDLYVDYKELHIRDEVSKTFGRRIKLMISSKLLKDYVLEKGLNNEDYLFPINPKVVNRYLKRLASKILGEHTSEAGEKFSELTMYDFRHISCCYWLPRYKSESALKYRFGWKKSDKIHYYSELLGMK
ncbi:MAG: tyrosine-type recombinase/integrase, partial [archaeon]